MEFNSTCSWGENIMGSLGKWKNYFQSISIRQKWLNVEAIPTCGQCVGTVTPNNRAGRSVWLECRHKVLTKSLFWAVRQSRNFTLTRTRRETFCLFVAICLSESLFSISTRLKNHSWLQAENEIVEVQKRCWRLHVNDADDPSPLWALLAGWWHKCLLLCNIS